MRNEIEFVGRMSSRLCNVMEFWVERRKKWLRSEIYVTESWDHKGGIFYFPGWGRQGRNKVYRG